MTYYLFVYVLVEMPRRKLAVGHRQHSGALQKTGLWCIFAIAQHKYASQNLIAFLSCLKSAGYNVILVNNGNLSGELIKRFLSYCYTVIERPRGGRDFGGYKCGTKTLFDMKNDNQEIAQVIYCNDSIFVRPSTLELLLARIGQMNDDYIGITETFDPSYHVQSWFFVTSGQLFRSSDFQQFWQKYLPLSYRRHCITKGEAGISDYLSKHSVYPYPIYTQGIILDLICGGTASEAVDKLLFGLSPDHYHELTTTMQRIGFSPLSDEHTALSFLRRDIMEEIGMSNTMNTANLILLKHTTFPFLKKDLIYRGDYLFAQIEDAIAEWAGDDADFLAEIFAYFRSRGTLRHRHSPAAILARMGLV